MIGFTQRRFLENGLEQIRYLDAEGKIILGYITNVESKLPIIGTLIEEEY